MDISKEPAKTPTSELRSAETHFKYKNPGKAAFAQFLATFIQCILLIEIGLELTMPTVVLGSLYKIPAEPLNMNDDQASWFGSIPDFCHPLASLTSGFFQEKFGRKGAMIIINIPIFMGWMILYSAQSVYSLYAASMIMGLCTGLSEASLHSYIGEIGEPHLRGTLYTVGTFFTIIGFTTTHLLNYLFNWRTVALSCSSCSVITFVLMTQLPESPTWLIVRGRLDEARKSLCWVRGWVSPDEVEEEFQALINYVQKKSGENAGGSPTNPAVGGKPIVNKDGFFKRQFKELKKKQVLRPLRLVLVLFVTSLIAGVTGVKPYLISELKRLGSPVNPKLIMIIFTGLGMVGLVVNVMLLRRLGKRKIALFSISLSAATIFSIGAYDFLQLDTTQNVMLPWIPVIFWMIIHFLSGLSVLSLPWQLVGEIFPPLGRGTATGIAAAWAHLVASVLVKSYLYIVARIGFSGTMYLYGLLAISGVVYYYLYLPETEGKTLAEIETYFTENYDRKEMFSIGKAGKKASIMTKDLYK